MLLDRTLSSDAKQRLSPVDTAWFRMDERHNSADIAVLMLLEGALDHAHLLDTLRARLLPHPRFRQRVVDSAFGLSSPTWQSDTDFRIERHVLQRATQYSSMEALQDIVSELTSEPLDFSHSPWRVCIVQSTTGESALVAQIHHCMGDGFALLSLLLSVAEGAESDETKKPGEAKSRAKGFLPIAKRSFGVAKALLRLLLLSFQHTQLHQQLSGQRRMAWSKGMPLSDVKVLARAQGATVNDVLMVAVTAALRRYLGERGPPAGVRAIVPVDLRPPGVPLDGVNGNWFGLVFASLPTGEPDDEQRFRSVKLEMDRIKASQEAIVTLSLLHVLGRIPKRVNRVFNLMFGRKASVVVSNVPGPRSMLKLSGQNITQMMFWAPHPCGLGCGASILSYAGWVRVGIRSDSAVMPDPVRLAEYFDQELARLASATVAG